MRCASIAAAACAGLVEHALLDERDDAGVRVALEQRAHEPAADEAGKAGEEVEGVGHGTAV